MGLFGNGHGERIADLERLVATLTARVVKAEATASEAAERAYRYMKKAEARARREVDVGDPEAAQPNQDRASQPPGTPAASISRRDTWGARGRRLARASRRDPALELNGAAHEDAAD